MLNTKNMKQSLPADRQPQYLDPWQKIDNFYYPFLNSYIFSFDTNKNEPAYPVDSYAVKLQPIEHFPEVERATRSAEVKSHPLIKKQQAEKVEKAGQRMKIVVRDRNILSNNTNLILSLIRRPSKSQHRVIKIISRLNNELKLDYNLKRFYSYQNYIKENVNDYRNKNAIQVIVVHCDPTCPIFSVPEQLFFNQVCRMLIRHYIYDTLLLDVLSLKKIKKTSRGDHLKVQRYLARVLEGPKSAEYCTIYKL